MSGWLTADVSALEWRKYFLPVIDIGFGAVSEKRFTRGGGIGCAWPGGNRVNAVSGISRWRA